MGDLESTTETRLNSSLSSSRIPESWDEPQISSLSCQTCPRWLIPMECGWVKSKNKEQGLEEDQSKGNGNENPKSGELTELRGNCRKWGHNVLSCWHGKEKQVNGVRSSSSSTLVATEVNAEKSWLGMVVGFIAINQFSVDFVTSVHGCPKSCATYATLSLKVWGMREVVSNEINLHGEEVFTVNVFAVVCEGRRRQLLSMIWWEIEGFLLTVGDGYRKLGGHGREMILRRDGDSPPVNDAAAVVDDRIVQV